MGKLGREGDKGARIEGSTKRKNETVIEKTMDCFVAVDKRKRKKGKGKCVCVCVVKG